MKLMYQLLPLIYISSILAVPSQDFNAEVKELEDTLAENFANSGDGKRQPPAPPIPPVATRARRAANFDAESWLQLRKDDSGPWPWLEPRQETQAVQQDMPPPPPNEGENENGDEVDFGLEMEDENARAARLREQARAELRGKKALFLMSEAPAHRIRCHVSLVLDRPTDLVNHYLAGPDWHRRNWAREEGVGYLKWWLQELFPDYAPNVSDYQGVFRIDWRRGETTGVQMGMEWRTRELNTAEFERYKLVIMNFFRELEIMALYLMVRDAFISDNDDVMRQMWEKVGRPRSAPP